ncbi:MAG: potassium channel family protein [Candidatus Marinarcus sp.]|uniref:potassium channel family protein n=1 Tax=Candidatus Marinarcus sp. TaxID=3100987 RepID=UPI003AFFC39A
MKNSSLWIVLLKMRMPFIVIIVTYTIAIIGLLVINGVDENGNPYHMTIFDAFYFVTYTATTIGFGETPYVFTYAQRLWVVFSIYLTVIGWFYGVGSLISLLQNKMFLDEMAKVRFRKQVRAIKKKYIIILGYNYITHEIIKKLIEFEIRVVVIEQDENRANSLILESFTPTVPVLVADAYSPLSLEEAGIRNPNCKALVSLFEEDALNLRIAIVSKLLNKNIMLIIKASTKNSADNLLDVNTEIIENPFLTIANELKMAIQSPHLLKLEKWIYKIDSLDAFMPKLPKGKYIICGFGRMGKSIYRVFKDLDIELCFIELDAQKMQGCEERGLVSFILGDADDKEVLLKAGVKNAAAIVAFTNNDTVNISILATAKKINKDIITLAREDEMDDISIFTNAQINYLFMPSKILINKTTNALINPLSDLFVRAMFLQNEQWAQLLVKELIQTIDEDPLLFEIEINAFEAYEINKALKEGHEINLSIFRVSLHNRNQNNNVVPLLLKRQDEEILLPEWDMKLKPEDKLLFACDTNAENDIEYIAQNMYEFHYALTGKEKTIFNKGLFK